VCMIHTGPKKSKRGVKLKVKDYEEHSLEYEIKEIFIGERTLFSMLGLVVGGIMVGRSIFEYSHHSIGLPLTITIGIVIFTVSGIFLKKFHQ
jgi:hypothetical protein